MDKKIEISEDSARFIRIALTKIADDAERDAELERKAKRFPGAYSLQGIADCLRDVLLAVPKVE